MALFRVSAAHIESSPMRIGSGSARGRADPSYPGAHAVIATAGAEVLISFFREHNFDFSVTSEVMPGVERSFTSFKAAAEEAKQSRLFAGVHFPFDLSTGSAAGR
jgi:membrane-associated phospholipid phosphatase